MVANFHDQTVAPSALLAALDLHVVPIETTLKQNTNTYSNLKHATETMREYLIYHGEGWQATLVEANSPISVGTENVEVSHDNQATTTPSIQEMEKFSRD